MDINSLQAKIEERAKARIITEYCDSLNVICGSMFKYIKKDGQRLFNNSGHAGGVLFNPVGDWNELMNIKDEDFRERIKNIFAEYVKQESDKILNQLTLLASYLGD